MDRANEEKERDAKLHGVKIQQQRSMTMQRNNHDVTNLARAVKELLEDCRVGGMTTRETIKSADFGVSTNRPDNTYVISTLGLGITINDITCPFAE